MSKISPNKTPHVIPPKGTNQYQTASHPFEDIA